MKIRAIISGEINIGFLGLEVKVVDSSQLINFVIHDTILEQMVWTHGHSSDLTPTPFSA